MAAPRTWPKRRCCASAQTGSSWNIATSGSRADRQPPAARAPIAPRPPRNHESPGLLWAEGRVCKPSTTALVAANEPSHSGITTIAHWLLDWERPTVWRALRIDHPVAGSAGSTPRVLAAVQLESRQTAGCHGTFLSRRQLIGGWPGGRRAVANRPALGVGNESRSRPWGSCYRSHLKAAVHTRYGPPDVVQISEVKKAGGRGQRAAHQGSRDDCEPDGLRLPVGQTLLLEIFYGARRAKGGRSWGTILREESRRSAVTSRPSRSATECSDSSDSAARSVLML